MHVARAELEIHLDVHNTSVSRSAREETVSIALSIAENVLFGIVMNADDDKLQEMNLARLKRLINELADVVVAYFSEPSTLPNPPDAITFASLRFLGIWLSEESDMHPLMNDILPTLLALEDKSCVIDCFTYLLPGLVFVTSAQSLSKVFVACKGLEKLTAYIQRNVDSLLKAFLSGDLTAREFSFSPAHTPFNLLTSICNIVMNVLTLSAADVTPLIPSVPLLLRCVNKLQSVLPTEENSFVLANVIVALLYVLKSDRQFLHEKYLSQSDEEAFFRFALQTLDQATVTKNCSESMLELSVLGKEASALYSSMKMQRQK